MQLYIQNQQDKVEVPASMQDLLQKVASRVLEVEDLPPELEVGIILVDDQKIRELNNNYRGMDAATDVLSFALWEQGGEEPIAELVGQESLLGDVVISLETAKRQAKEYGHSWEREVGFLAVHGLLHLLGYEHETSELRERMRRREEDVLSKLDLER